MSGADEENYDDPVVTLDAWENQRYKPMQGGWQPPFVSGVPNMSDITGNFMISVGENNLPVSQLPTGWEWICDWSVDVSNMFGSCDSDGWSYASSFESIFEASQKKLLAGEMGRLSLVRRRRWIRRRKCITVSAKRDFQARIFWNQSLQQRLDRVLCSRELEFAMIQQFESKRRTAFEEAVALADTVLQETIAMLEGVGEKLGQMKSFLQERGQIEREYAKKLDSLSAKWKYAGQPPNYMPPPDGSPPPNAGFFYVVSSANQIFSVCLGDFASLLDGSLPLDVDGIINEVFTVKNDCTFEGPGLRASVRASEDVLQRALGGYKQAFSTARIFAATESVRLMTTLYSGSVSAEADIGIAGVGLSSAGLGVSPSPSSPAPANSSPRKPSLSTARNDVWLAMQRYYRACSKADAELLIYCAFATQQRKVARMTGSRVAALLQSTVKVFAHEQCRAFEDGVTELRKVGARMSTAGPGGQGGSQTSPAFSRASTLSVEEEEGLMGLMNPALPTLPRCGAVAKKGILQCAMSVGSGLNRSLAGAAISSPSRLPAKDHPVLNRASSNGTPAGVDIGGLFVVPSAPASPDFQWTSLVAVVTFDGTLLLYHFDSYTPDTEELSQLADPNALDQSNDNISALLDSEPLAILDLNCSEVQPLLLLGLDAFVVKPRRQDRSPFALASGVDRNSSQPPTHSATSGSTGCVTSLALLAGGSDDAREWMRVLSTPLCDPKIDPPELQQTW